MEALVRLFDFAKASPLVYGACILGFIILYKVHALLATLV